MNNRRRGPVIFSLMMIASLLFTAPTDAQVESTVDQQTEAAEEVMAQIEASPDGLMLEEIDALDQLGPNPWLSFTAERSPEALAAWREIAEQLPSEELLANARAQTRSLPLTITESEEPDETGLNDTPETGDPIVGFGTRNGEAQVVTVRGNLSGGTIREPGFEGDCESVEDDGSIPLANEIPTDFPSRLCLGEIGDGPFGDSSGDVDFYSFGEVEQGTVLIVDVFNVSGSVDPADTIIAIYDADGTLLASEQDTGVGEGDTIIFLEAPTDGVYFAAIAGCCSLPSDPFDSSSVGGAAETGTYDVFIDVLPPPCESSEDDGSIPLANDASGVNGSPDLFVIACAGEVGDGPQATVNGDVDIFRTRPLPEDRLLIVDLAAISPGSNAGELTIGVYNSAGDLIGSGQDDPNQGGPASDFFSIVTPSADTYYVAIGGGLPSDPNDPTSGTNTDIVGDYTDMFIVDTTEEFLGGGFANWGSTNTKATVSEAVGRSAMAARQAVEEPVVDTDFFLVDLRKGDAIAGGFDGARTVGILDPDGILRSSSNLNLSFAYPASSPLRHDRGNNFDHVATVDGVHAVFVDDGTASYEGELRLVRSGLATESNSDQQIIFLDFDGAEVSGDVFGTGEDAVLSPLSAFLSRWGLTPDDEDAVIDATIDAVVETIDADLRVLDGRNGDRDSSGTPSEFDVEVLNSRDHGDLWGQPNVTRMIVGGTIDELLIPTLGIAQSIDPGNTDTEETGVILLDIMSEPAGIEASINSYGVAPGATKAEFVGFTLGHITAHEVGHVIGNWHQETFNEIDALMDAGGDFPAIAGVGPDGIFGTADDTDPDFVEDVFNSFEGFVGTEDTAGRSAFAFSTGLGAIILNPVLSDLEIVVDSSGMQDQMVDVAGSFLGGTAPYEITVDWGDGTSCPGVGTCEVIAPGENVPGSIVASHTYPNPGSYTITVTVTDATGASISATGTAALCTIIGTDKADRLRGTAGDDVICGLGGDDVIFGLSGNDLILGADGNDIIFAGGGNDTVYGGPGDDRIQNGSGDDTVYGGLGDDDIRNEAGSDTMYGGADNDAIRGGSGHDSAFGGSGDDGLFGGAGNDMMSGDEGDDEVFGGRGNDVVSGGADNDNVQGGSGADVVDGDQGDDTVDGGPGPDDCSGGGGQNTVVNCEVVR